MSQSDNTDQIALALSVAQSSMKAAQINKTNPHFQNRYADLAAVIEAVRLPLAAQALSITQTTDLLHLGDGISAFYLTTTLLHKSGQWISSTYPLPDPSKSKPQELGSALTYARRYSLSSICGIAADEDDDGEAMRKVGAKDDGGAMGRALAAVEARKAEKGPLDD